MAFQFFFFIRQASLSFSETTDFFFFLQTTSLEFTQNGAVTQETFSEQFSGAGVCFAKLCWRWLKSQCP